MVRPLISVDGLLCLQVTHLGNLSYYLCSISASFAFHIDKLRSLNTSYVASQLNYPSFSVHHLQRDGETSPKRDRDT